ncbi:hypothetical protein ASC77_06820 [Nocardioides sp. Root1257]|uniref:hypothetical protein n=1 Tax=unclassified Nocardioides TaxID=2615069 RepID=UPI0006F9E7C7|nr:MULTISPECIES: hypothetical protein [unclassified Nocardioides]KQW48466.1 hypothetical protein ASC77_06820 [Nocardioides sp. Root1257]KRC47641.1 hypothetical protein ASE24_06820 [Nocardioides sp. Root224]
MPGPLPAPLVLAASTVMDSPEHVRRYVEGNLAGGVDHLVVFLDKPNGPRQDEVAAYLDEYPAVTCVRAGSGWWAGARPRELNERQCTNANLAKDVLAGLGLGDAFVFHVDGDEVLRLDPAAMSALPAGTTGLRAATREALSRRTWDGEPTLFKRELDEPDLRLLHGLGLVPEPTNQAYFRGHLMGKSGVRVGERAWLTLHKVVADDGSPWPLHEADGLELFHYESYSAEEFVRKWTAMVASGPKASYRPDRQPAARTLRALINRGLEPAALDRQLVRFYERYVEEEVDALHDLGVLVETDPLVPLAQRPAAGVPAADLAAALEERRSETKQAYFKGTSPGARTAAAPARGLGRLVKRG